MNGEPYYTLELMPIDEDYYYYDIEDEDPEEYEGRRFIFMELSISGCDTVLGSTFYLKYNTNMLIPRIETVEKQGKVYVPVIKNPSTVAEWADIYWSVEALDELDTQKGWIGYEGGSTEYIEQGQVIATFMFELAEGYTYKDITKSDICLNKGRSIDWPNGICIPYDGSRVWVSDEYYFTYKGFPEESEKVITDIQVVSQMDNDEYYQGERLDFTGVELEIYYEGEDEPERKTLQEALEEGLIELDRTIATLNDNSTVKGKATEDENITFDLNYRVITDMKITTPPTETNYRHGEYIEFAGGVVTLTFDDGDPETVDLEEGINGGRFIPNTTVAAVNNTTITVTYKNSYLSDNFQIHVYDPIVKVEIVNQPDDVEYIHNEEINPEGGKLRVTRESGNIEFIDMDSDAVSINPDRANINNCNNIHENTSGERAGTQDITVTFTEKDEDGKEVTVTAENKFTITVNDTITSIKVISDPIAKNKYGTPGNQLDLAGAKLEVTTASEATFEIEITAGMLDLDSYDSQPSNLDEMQNLQVTYASKQTQDGQGVNIKLYDYVESIEIILDSDLEEYYNTPIQNVDFTKVKYKERYASGKVGDAKSITYNNVTGYKPNPDASDFDINHKCEETLTLKIIGEDEFNTEISNTFSLTIKDVVTGIIVSQRPNITNYDYGAEFSKTGGRIKFYYASGAEDTSIGISMNDPNVTIVEENGTLDLTKMEPKIDEGYTFEEGKTTITLKVTYKDAQNNTHDTTFTIVVKDALEKILIEGNKQTEFEHGDNFTLGENASLKLKYKSGTTKEISLDDITVIDTDTEAELNMSPDATAYNPTDNKVEKNVKLQYEDGSTVVESDSYGITIENTIERIIMKQNPTITKYNVKETNWNLDGGQIYVIRKTGNPVELDLTATGVTVQALSQITNQAGNNKPVQVTYQDPDHPNKTYNTTFNIDVVDGVTGVTITGPSDIINYNYGEKLNYDNIEIYVHHASDNENYPGELVPVSQAIIVDITDNQEEGETPTTIFTEDKFGKDHTLTRTLRVTYTRDDESDTFEFDIKVFNIVDKIEIDEDNEPEHEYVLYGDTDNPGGKIKVYRKASSTTYESVNITKEMVEDLDTNEPGTNKTATVKYESKDAHDQDNTKTTTYKYNVTDTLNDVEITQTPTKLDYNWGDKLDLTGLEIVNKYVSGDKDVNIDENREKIDIKEVKEDGSEVELNMQPAGIEFKDGDTIEKTVKIKYTYEDKSDEEEITITIKDNPKQIQMSKNPAKKDYNVNENEWDLKAEDEGNAEILVTYQSGRTKKENITPDMLPSISDLTSIEGQNKPVKVTYPKKDVNGNEITTQFTINVGDGITRVEIDISELNNSEYNWGDEIDWSKLKVTLEYTSGTQSQITDIDQVIKRDITNNQDKEVTTELSYDEFNLENHFKSERTIKVRYSVTNKDGTTAYDEKEIKITVFNIVDTIVISTSPRKEYELYEETAPAGGTIIIYRKANPSNHGEEKTIDDTWITDLSTEQEGIGLTATVTYKETAANGKDVSASTTYNYDVLDSVQNVEITGDLPQSDYFYGDELDLSDLKLKITKTSGPDEFDIDESDLTIEEVISTDPDVTNEINKTLTPDASEFASQDTIEKTIRITYDKDGTTVSKEFTITITNDMVSIKLNPEPDKQEYHVGDGTWNLDAAGGNNGTADVEITYAAGNKKKVDLTDTMLTPLATLTNVAGTGKKVTVTYGTDKGGNPLTTDEFTIDVVDEINEIIIEGDMQYTDYNYGETLDYTGVTIKVIYDSGREEPISLSDAKIKDITAGDLGDNSPNATTELSSLAFVGQANHIAERTLKISYTEGNKTASKDDYKIRVLNTICEVKVSKTNPPRTEYEIDDETGGVGGKLEIYRSADPNNVAEEVNIQDTWVSGLDTSEVGKGFTATVKYTEKDIHNVDITKQATYKYSVTDTVESIELDPLPTKLEYKYGEPLSVEGGKIKVKKPGNKEKIVDLTTNMVTGFERTPTGQTYPYVQTLTVTYGKNAQGEDVTKTYEITMYDYISEIKVIDAKEDYIWNEELDKDQGYLKVTMASGTQVPNVDLDDEHVTIENYSKTTIGDQTLTVKYNPDDYRYGEVSTTYVVTVEDYITETIIQVPTKDTYYYGDSLDLTTGKIIQKWASGAEDTIIQLDESMVFENDGTSPVNMTPSSFPESNKVPKTLKVKYNELVEDYDICIINDVKSVEVKNPKKDYDYGDSFDYETGTVEVTYADGTKESYPLDDDRVHIDGFDSESGETTQIVEVEFTENGVTKKASYDINVNDNISSIKLIGTPIDEYLYGDSINLQGLQLEITRPSGVSYVPVTASMISGYNPNQLGKQTVTVTYAGQEVDTYEVNVIDWLKDIELVKPTKVNYKIGEDLSLAGASITEVYASGKKVTGIKVTKEMVTGFDSSSEGAKTLTVKYTKDNKTFRKDFVIIVSDELSGIEVKSFPKDRYLYGENLDLTGATLEVTLESGETMEVPITKDMVSGYNTRPSSSNFETSDEYLQIITITYTRDGITKTAKYPVTTVDYTTSIVVEGMKTEYIWGEELNLDKATVAKVSASGVISDKVQLTKDMVSGYDARKEGNQTLTISYAEMTTTEVVKVVDNILGISINQLPNKTKYKYGSDIDLTGAKLNVIKNSGTYVIDITKDMISGYNATKAGIQTITVTYGGYTAEFIVTVEPKATVTTPSNSNKGNKTESPTVEEPEELEQVENQEPEVLEPEVQEPEIQKPQQKPNTDKKQEAVLGVQDEQKDGIDFITLMTYIMMNLLALLLILLIMRRKNVEIYVVEDEENCILIGKDKLSSDDKQEIDLVEYMKEYIDKDIEVVLTKRIAKKLDGKTVIFKLPANKERKVVVKYEDNEFVEKFEKTLN